MERASEALEATRYFECEKLTRTALQRAHAAGDYERMARIILPLQEARRQRRQLAVDASFGPGGRGVTLFETRRAVPNDIAPGCYLFQPPLIGADARAFRDHAAEQQVPVFVLTREPLTRDGLWPIVSVGAISVRAKLAPPFRVEFTLDRPSRDGVTPADAAHITRAWFESTAEALGDSAIASLKTDDPAAWLVEDLLDRLEAFPDHEKLHQRLADACRGAMVEPPPAIPRRRGMNDDPFSF